MKPGAGNGAAPVPLIEARGLHSYYGASHVLRGVDLTVMPGETVSLIGRNGITVRSIPRNTWLAP